MVIIAYRMKLREVRVLNNLEEIKLQIATTLKRIRIEKNITQKELGDHLGVGGSTISAWERGQNSIDITVLVKICEFLGISINEFDTGNTENIDLSKEEKQLILSYRKLSKENKTKVIGFIEMAKE
jgi:transcriptional regulator with XRE-family HTH domain